MFDIKEVWSNSIERIIEQYIKPMTEENKVKKESFVSGQIMGLCMALDIMRNDIESFIGEECLNDFHLEDEAIKSILG